MGAAEENAAAEPQSRPVGITPRLALRLRPLALRPPPPRRGRQQVGGGEEGDFGNGGLHHVVRTLRRRKGKKSKRN